MTNLTVRRLTERDIPAALPLRLSAAQHRARLEPLLWPLHPAATECLRAELERQLSLPERLAWFLTEQGGEVVGVAQSGRYPAPPVYAELLAGQTGGDLYATAPEALAPLLDASEEFQVRGNVALHTAVCPAQDGEKLAFLRGRGYRPLTNWMVQAVNPQAACPASVRPATEADIPALVELNAAAQQQKKQANPRFWTPHPEAPKRFAAWLHHSLTLTDRRLLVSQQGGQVRGFVIVQPTPHLSAAHDPSGTATVDDLAAADWDSFRDLLQAAQHRAAQRQFTTLQVISPVNWPERNEALQDAGFHTANLWLLREPSA